MAYTTIDDPSAYFQTKIYTGNGSSSHAITFDGNSDLQPDWTWIKSRSNDTDHILTDIVRGVGVGIKSNTTAGNANDSNQLKSFNSDGFTLGSENDVNGSSRTYASWNWKAGTSFTNDASATGIGTIDSNGSVSSDAGFGIVKWSGTGSAGTIAHNMGSTPSFLIIKRLSDANWLVQATTLGYGNYLALNTTGASASASTLVTGVSSTLVTLGDNGSVNGSGQDYIGYFFSEKQGYSKFGSYIANSNSSNFIYTGFKPAFLMVKQTDSGGNQNWGMFDNKRPGYNSQNGFLYANTNGAEDTSNATSIDLLSNGFQLRANTVGSNPGKSYIYMCFASNPLVTSTGVPTTAR